MKESFVLLAIFLSAVALLGADATGTCVAFSQDDRCLDSTCGVAVTRRADSCLCNEHDVGYTFSDCHANSNVRTVSYFWKAPMTCVQHANFSLPPSFTLPCDVSCEPGTRLGLTSPYMCRECEPGTAAMDGVRHWTSWGQWPAQFSSRCTVSPYTTGKCEPWRLLETHIDSGNNGGVDRIESILSLDVNLVAEGSVSFRYRVSSEPVWDGLQFRVDGVPLVFVTGSLMNWTLYEATLSRGHHYIEWNYNKDGSMAAGEDRAWIDMIRVTGLTLADLRCLKCQPGTYQPNSKQSVCLRCPANEYSAVSGARSCEPCPGGQASYPGASSCFMQRNCTPEDLTSTTTACDPEAHTQTKTYSWISPPACDTSSAKLPDPEVVPCTLKRCHPGQRLDATDNCQYCPAGQVSDGTSGCHACAVRQQPGTMSTMVDTWGSELPSGFSTTCVGACTSQGWRVAGSFIDSGSHHGPVTTSTLTLDTTIGTGGGLLSFDVQVSCDPTFQLNVLNGAKPLLDIPCSGCSAPIRRYNVTLPTSGVYQLNWVWRKGTTVPTTVDCDSVRIYGLNVSNVLRNGGAGICVDCPAGTRGQDDATVPCEQCPAGTSSLAGQSACDVCPPNTYSKAGFGRCMPCGAGTTSAAQSATCGFNCTHIELAKFATDPANSTVFDLSFAGFNRTIATGGGQVRNTFTFSMCQQMQCRPGTAATTGFYCQNVYVPATDENVLSVGDVVSFQPHTAVREGFLVTFNSSTLNMCLASVLFQCDPLASAAGEIVQQSATVAGCARHFLWRSVSACRQCTLADRGVREGPCVKGTKDVEYFWVTDLCSGGVPLPAAGKEACEDKVSVNKTYVWIGVGVAVALAAAAIGVISFLIYKNRKIYNSYKRLQLSDAPMEGPL